MMPDPRDPAVVAAGLMGKPEITPLTTEEVAAIKENLSSLEVSADALRFFPAAAGLLNSTKRLIATVELLESNARAMAEEAKEG